MIEQEPPSSPGSSATSGSSASSGPSASGSTKVDCTETVLRIFEFLDGEMNAEDCRRMQVHLDECEPCLREYQMDQALKMVIKRSCGCEAAPVELRTTILRRLTMIRIETSD